MSTILKALFTIFLIGLAVYVFRFLKRRSVAVAIGLSAVIILSSIISGAVLGLIPLPTEQVIITSLGTKNENSKGNEIVLSGLQVDGVVYPAANAAEGKWMWRGNDYLWRNENDGRQPDGLTRSITCDIPVGTDRFLKLDKSQYRGFVEVSYNGKSEQYDLYNAEYQKNNIRIPSSDNGLILTMKIGRLILYALFVLILSAIPFILLFKNDDDKVRAFFRKHWDKFVYIALATLAFFIMFRIASMKGAMWYDEVWTIGWHYMGRQSDNCLMFSLLTNMWTGIAPYGENNLLLLPMLITAVSVYIIGIAGAEFRDKKLGIIAAALAASSSTILSQAGMEYRPYFLVFFFSSLTFYMFVRKIKTTGNEKISTILIYSVFLALAMDSHDFGLAASGVLMIFDFVLIIAKKSKKICWFEFVLPGAYGIYYLLTQFITNVAAANDYSWTKAPTLETMLDAVNWMNGSNVFFTILMLLGVSVICISIISKIRSRSFDVKNDPVNVALIVIPFVIFNLNTIYSFFINPNNSLFVNRYFTSIVIYTLFTIATAICEIIDLIKNNMNSSIKPEPVLAMFTVLALCVTSWGSFWRTDPTNEKFKECADYLMSQNDIYSDNTAYYLCGRDAVYYGMGYYLSHKGQRDLPRNYINLYYGNIKTGYGDFEKKDYLTDFNKYDVIYISYIHWNKNASICGNAFDVLNENFKLDYEKSDLKLARYVRK